jgi:hypothetical protein
MRFKYSTPLLIDILLMQLPNDAVNQRAAVVPLPCFPPADSSSAYHQSLLSSGRSPTSTEQALVRDESLTENAADTIVGLAISGGADSIALAYLCKNGAPVETAKKLVAFVVDHGLRPGSDAEAEAVKSRVENTIGRPLPSPPHSRL